MDAGVVESLLRLGNGAVGDGGKTNADGRFEQLVGYTAPHITGADNSDANWLALLFSLFESYINYNHRGSIEWSKYPAKQSQFHNQAKSDQHRKPVRPEEAIQFQKHDHRSERHVLKPERKRRSLDI